MFWFMFVALFVIISIALSIRDGFKYTSCGNKTKAERLSRSFKNISLSDGAIVSLVVGGMILFIFVIFSFNILNLALISTKHKLYLISLWKSHNTITPGPLGVRLINSFQKSSCF